MMAHPERRTCASASTNFRSAAAVVAILGMTLAASALSERPRPEALDEPLATIPSSLAGWNSIRDEPLASSTLTRLVLTDYISRVYAKDENQLGLFIAYYAEQRSGESMHSPKHCLPGSGWEIWQYGSVEVPVNGGTAVVNKYSIHKGTLRNVVLYWYQSGPRVIASEYYGKLLLMRDAMFDGRTDGAIVRIILPDVPGAVQEGVNFAARLIPEVQRCYGLPSGEGDGVGKKPRS
ncbi:MAG TPA: EpsI family protein [Bryobacteraceae bacterium]|jgi:EpsI family protein